MIKKVTVSLADYQVRYIERQNGVSFSEKLRRIIDRNRVLEDLSAGNIKSDFDTTRQPEQLKIHFEE